MSNVGLQSRVFHLLSLARTIRHYEEALSQARGERFNLFDILHVGHYEVRTHSPMLAELLSPRGSHGQGAVFLQHFLAMLNIHDFDAESARVAPEVSIGSLGRIDIVITDRYGRRVQIENKIYAGLQEKQLERYHQYDPKANLLYLTLNGDRPDDGTDTTDVPNLQLVSYRSHIVPWLERCRKEVATAPCVREAITQYIHLIQRLTQQNTSTQMNRELIEAVLKDKETYLAYASLRNEHWNIRKAIIAKLNAQLEPFIRGLGLEPVKTFSGQGERSEGCLFTTPALKAQNVVFGIECEVSDYRDVFFGFGYIGPDLNSALKPQIQEHFNKAFLNPTSSPWWPAWSWWDQHRNWDDETMSAIFLGEFAQDLKALIGKLAEVAAEASKASAVTT
jgi:PD-(D/E)XK nuclease superfamily